MPSFISIGSAVSAPQGGSKFTISHRLGEWLLQQCYALTCYTVKHFHISDSGSVVPLFFRVLGVLMIVIVVVVVAADGVIIIIIIIPRMIFIVLSS